jgi:hypothetical protein
MTNKNKKMERTDRKVNIQQHKQDLRKEAITSST